MIDKRSYTFEPGNVVNFHTLFFQRLCFDFIIDNWTQPHAKRRRLIVELCLWLLSPQCFVHNLFCTDYYTLLYQMTVAMSMPIIEVITKKMNVGRPRIHWFDYRFCRTKHRNTQFADFTKRLHCFFGLFVFLKLHLVPMRLRLKTTVNQLFLTIITYCFWKPRICWLLKIIQCKITPNFGATLTFNTSYTQKGHNLSAVPLRLMLLWFVRM